MKHFEIIDETFDINISSSYHLSMQMNKKGLCFAIMDTVRKKYIALKGLPFDESQSLSRIDQVKRLLSRDTYLSRIYKTSAFIYVSPNASIIPNPIYDSDKKEELFSFSNKLEENHYVEINQLHGVDSHILLSFPEKLRDVLEDHANDFKIFHQSCAAIGNACINTRQKSSSTKVIAHVYDDFLDIMVFQEGTFKLYNSFKYKTREDLVFYILYVYEQFGFKAGQTGLVLNGSVESDSELANQLSQYLGDISYGRFNKSYDYSYTFGQVDQHKFSNLIDLYSCV